MQTVLVHILDKEYQISCPPGQESSLRASAKHLDDKMRSIRNSGKIFGLERIAVMAALNITHELLQKSEVQHTSDEEIERQADALFRKIDDALHDLKQLEL